MAFPPLKLTLIAIVVALGGSFQFGYQLSFVNPTEELFRHFLNISWYEKFDRPLNDAEFAWLWTLTVNIFYVGALGGALLVSLFAERFGRKKAILLNNIPSFIGTLLIYVWPQTQNFELLIAGRFLIGCHSGLSSGLQSLYLAEISPPEFCGVLCAFQSLFIVTVVTLGTIVGLPEILGSDEHFLLLLALPAIPTVLYTFCMFFFAESPKHLLLTTKNRSKAISAVRFFAGPHADVQLALSRINAETVLESTDETFAKPTNHYRSAPFSVKFAVLVGVVAGIAQTCTGIMALESFSTSMFIAAGVSTSTAMYASVAVAATNTVANVVGLGAIHVIGRRPLLLITAIGTMACNCVYALFARLGCDWCGYLAVAAYLLHTIFFSIGIGVIPWFLAAEMVPHAYRSFAQMCSTCAIWLSIIVTGLVFYPLSKMEAVGPLAVLIVYVAPTVFCLAFLFVAMPETRGRELAEITVQLEKRFRARRHLSDLEIDAALTAK